MGFWNKAFNLSSRALQSDAPVVVDLWRITPRELRRFRKALDPRIAIDALIQCCECPDGYVRQAALETLREFDCPEAMPAVLWRLGDWVPEVRQAAWVTTEHMLKKGYSSKLVDCHQTIGQLRRVQRVDLSTQLNALRESMLEDASDALIAGLSDSWVTKRRFCFQTLSSDSRWDQLVIERGLQDRDPSIRRWLARRIVSGELTASNEVLRTLMFDRAAIVSTTVLLSLDEHRASLLTDDLIQLAMHPSARTRASARFWLRKTGIDDAANTIRKAFDIHIGDHPPAGVVAGLGELGGGDEDISRVRPLCQHPRTAVRLAAIQAIVSLTRDDEELETIIAAMRDSNAKIRWFARRAVVSRPRTLWFDRVCDVFLRGQSPASREAGLLLAEGADWSIVPVMLRALNGLDPCCSDLAYRGLAAWYSHYGHLGWIRPAENIWGQIIEVWDGVKHLKPPDNHAWAWEHLRGSIEQGVNEGWWGNP